MMSQQEITGSAGQPLILGAWRWNDLPMSPGEIEKLLHTGLELGISTIDHADIYGDYTCELLYGKVVKNNPDFRDQFRHITKCGIKLASDKFPGRILPTYDTSREHIVTSVETSLKNMDLEKLDLVLIHRPDPLMDPNEVAEAFTVLRSSGKVAEFGVSNFNREQFELLQAHLDYPLVTNQIELSLLNSEPFIDGSIDFLHTMNLPIMAWSPFGGGKLFKDEKLYGDLQPLAQRYECSVSALAIAWLLHHPATILPILGTTNKGRLHEIAKALEINLDREDWFKMLKYARGYDIP